MTFKTLKNKITGRITRFQQSEAGQRIIKRTKSFIWRYGLFVAISSVAYFVDQILPNLKISPELVAFIAYICNEITKELNTKKDVNS